MGHGNNGRLNLLFLLFRLHNALLNLWNVCYTVKNASNVLNFPENGLEDLLFFFNCNSQQSPNLLAVYAFSKSLECVRVRRNDSNVPTHIRCLINHPKSGAMSTKIQDQKVNPLGYDIAPCDSRTAPQLPPGWIITLELNKSLHSTKSCRVYDPTRDVIDIGLVLV